ncbi:MAG: response regulator [Candidatus Latescibacterota bacterium]
MGSAQNLTAGGQRILVVEDMAVVGADIHDTLTAAGYEVPAVVGSGEEAIRAAAELHPQVVLMDIRLAGQVDGVEAAQWIRQELAIPVIFLTAYSDEATLHRAMVTEPFGFIVKPINKRELLANIQVALYRSQIERAWRESEARYAAVVHQSSECILLADADGGRILEANPAAQRMLGYGPEELEGLTLREVLVGDGGEADRRLRELAVGQPALLGEQQYRTRGGRLIDVEVSATLIAYQDSQVVCAVARDVGERQRAQAALASAERELEAQRALTLRADRLRSLGAIARGLAQELARPLEGMRVVLQEALGRAQAAVPADRRLRQILVRVLGKLDNLAREVGEACGGPARGGRPERLPIQVNEVVGPAAELVRAPLEALGIELTCALVEGLPPVLADPFSLEEVVLSLLARAREAAERRSGPPRRVGVRTELATGQGEEVLIRIEDNGPPLVRGAAERSVRTLLSSLTAEDGAALGLVVARAVVEQYDGHLEVRCLPDQGTEVSIVLPAAGG